MEHYSWLIYEIVKKLSIESGKDVLENINKKHDLKYGVKIEKYNIDSDYLAEAYHKEKGLYTIISIGNVLYASNEILKYYQNLLEEELGSYLKINNDDSILVVGLGNENIGADSLGSKVVDKVIVTRNILNYTPLVSAISPGVLGKTGVESADIISGVIDKIKPNKLVIIDSLCASSSSRLACSIQITNTSIVPGAGVGNNRKTITKGDSVKDIVVIGVPMLIYASTYISENISLDKIIKKISKTLDLDCQKLKKLMSNENLYISQNYNDVVTLKDIDMHTQILANIISKAINKTILKIEDFGEI